VRTANVNLLTSPSPDYDDWFADLEMLRTEHKVKVKTSSLLVETSRGCWWGATKHCVFCGIDEETLRYRQKPPQQVLEMLREMRTRYGPEMVLRFSDYIFPKANYETLLPALAEESPKFKLWGEIKANQTRERVEAFANAGFAGMQPGIESFSSAVLKAMDKGVRAIDNVALLVHGYENRVIIEYNFLYGLPDDQPQDYREMIDRLPLLYHLTPPVSRTETIITRFAPLQASPDRFRIPARPRHYRSYDLIFSQKFLESAGLDLDDYCYYFERNFEYKPDLHPLYRLAVDIINCWKQQHLERPVWLSYRVDAEGAVLISDGRYDETVEYLLSPEAGTLFIASLPKPLNLIRYAEQNPSGQVTNAVQELKARRLVWEEKDLVLGIATTHDAAQERLRSGWVREWEGIYT
jgi:ribosomal peptide maturation radical SAM protein 1